MADSQTPMMKQYHAVRRELPPNTLLLEGNTNYPRQLIHYENFTYVPLDSESLTTINAILADPEKVLASWMDNRGYRATFVVITRSMKAYADAVRQSSEYPELGGLPVGALDKLEEALARSPKFHLVKSNEDVKIFSLFN